MQKYFEEGLELGRSFVQPKYWGKRSLDYLWFGIGAFIKQYPHYRYLFGPVSIPGTYPQTAISLLVDFYSKHFPHQEALAHPKTPVLKPKDPLMTFAGEHYDEEFSQLKDVLSHMNIKVPTLVKQYSELCEPDGVSYIAFNRDPDFNDCIDGLVMIDLNKLTKKKRKRYLS
jgi:hypothetical protein